MNTSSQNGQASDRKKTSLESIPDEKNITQHREKYKITVLHVR